MGRRGRTQRVTPRLLLKQPRQLENKAILLFCFRRKKQIPQRKVGRTFVQYESVPLLTLVKYENYKTKKKYAWRNQIIAPKNPATSRPENSNAVAFAILVFREAMLRLFRSRRVL
jgi:hypothetical protein